MLTMERGMKKITADRQHNPINAHNSSVKVIASIATAAPNDRSP
jgi:hypothetical protein